MAKPAVLVTGGLGYIGSNTVVELIEASYPVIIIDNLHNSSKKVLESIKKITGTLPTFYEADVQDKSMLDILFARHSIGAVMHFAGYKAVGESVANPLSYYQNNLDSSLTLLEAMLKHEVYQLIFSSSATVYAPLREPRSLSETDALAPTNPYGQTKSMIEQIIDDTTVAQPRFMATKLRYFNPIGAHESGLLGEDPSATPNNLLPYISRVASNELKQLSVFGDNYPTTDGTGVRDYIHVSDLAQGHIAALEHIEHGSRAYNLGTGKGTSVLELIKAFESASSITVPYKVTKRRPGDIAYAVADPGLAADELNWRAKRTIKQACRDEWRWQQNRRAKTL